MLNYKKSDFGMCQAVCDESIMIVGESRLDSESETEVVFS